VSPSTPPPTSSPFLSFPLFDAIALRRRCPLEKGHFSIAMAPSFLSDFRRRSKASFRTEVSVDTSQNGLSNGQNSHSSSATPSSSTLNLAYGSTTPPALSTSNSAANLQSVNGAPAPPVRPHAAPSVASRQSVSGMSGLGAPNSTLPTSQYAPRILSISDNSWVSAPVCCLTAMADER
jgi:hypothetical protein